MLKILKARQAQWEENFIPRIHTFNVDFKRTVKMSHLFCFVSLIKNVLNSCSFSFAKICPGWLHSIIVGLHQPRPPDKISYKFNGKNCECLQ